MSDVRPGQLWRDVDGFARVYGVVPVEGTTWVVLRRWAPDDDPKRPRLRRPFMFAAKSMLRGDDGWELAEIAAVQASAPLCELEKQIKTQIRDIHREYAERCQPLIDQLVKIESRKLPGYAVMLLKDPTDG